MLALIGEAAATAHAETAQRIRVLARDQAARP
jgi:hypothetical protein